MCKRSLRLLGLAMALVLATCSKEDDQNRQNLNGQGDSLAGDSSGSGDNDTFAGDSALPPGPAMTDLHLYIFGHSLFNYGDAASTEDHLTAEWFGRWAAHEGYDSSVGGKYGQPDYHLDSLPITRSQWNYAANTYDPWPYSPGATFLDQDFNHVMWMPSNWGMWDLAIDNGPDDIASSVALVDYMTVNAPNAQVLIYEHWPKVGNANSNTLPDGPALTAQQWIDYWNWTRTEQLDWFDRYLGAVEAQRPAVTIRRIPVGPVMADLFLNESYMSGAVSTDYFFDGAPHGTVGLYLLAAAIGYRALFGVNAPTDYVLPTTSPVIPPEIVNNWAAIIAYVETRLSYYHANGMSVY